MGPPGTRGAHSAGVRARDAEGVPEAGPPETEPAPALGSQADQFLQPGRLQPQQENSVAGLPVVHYSVLRVRQGEDARRHGRAVPLREGDHGQERQFHGAEVFVRFDQRPHHVLQCQWGRAHLFADESELAAQDQAAWEAN